ncbi:putative HTH transcriptional regulator [Pedobacter africanus]|uniref:HTH transcriptional regulator n=1 Tax=Pedobacter africanus TaxID=151894 RepID=A0ACC6KTL4_9SPHI|nr:HTH domain-containing protein [Pedobacter africanus]MDR6782679.1 putative HTH transcriptional regulator [Pedobacter africanus]
MGEKLTKTQVSIIAEMRRNNKVSLKEMAKSLRISDTAIENNIKYLREKGLIIRIGPAKGGYWEVKT